MCYHYLFATKERCTVITHVKEICTVITHVKEIRTVITHALWFPKKILWVWILLCVCGRTTKNSVSMSFVVCLWWDHQKFCGYEFCCVSVEGPPKILWVWILLCVCGGTTKNSVGMNFVVCLWRDYQKFCGYEFCCVSVEGPLDLSWKVHVMCECLLHVEKQWLFSSDVDF